MPTVDTYTARTTGTTVNASTFTPILGLQPATTKRVFVVGIRIDIGVTTAAAGASVLFQLMRPGNTGSIVGTGAITPNPHDPAAPASLATSYATWSTAPTTGLVLWEQELPFTTGSSWEEFPPSGYEWVVPTTAAFGVVVAVTCSTANSTPFYCDLIFTE